MWLDQYRSEHIKMKNNLRISVDEYSPDTHNYLEYRYSKHNF